jgi:ankyrin repeat protein
MGKRFVNIVMQVCEVLLAGGADVNAVDRWSGTPLADAINFGHDDTIVLLTQAGGKVRARY